MYKVLALDLDGTLLNSQHSIHPAVKSVIHEASKACHVILVTGRHHTAAKPYHRELELNSPIICCNGAYIYDYHINKVLVENSVKKKNAKTFFQLADEHNLKVVLYTTHSMLYSRDCPVEYMAAMEKWAEKKFCVEERPDIRRIDSFNQEIDDAEYIWKFVIEGEPESIAKILELDFVKQNFSAERSWANRFDFTSQGNSKGRRLADYLKQNNYSAQELMAIGDNHNDVSMIKLAGLGVAMKNADEKVKSIADLVSPTDNNQDGIACLIREKIQI